MKIALNDVSSVYSGRHGCCCGCRGKHTYASAHRQWASENRGYKVEANEVNDRTVKMIVKKIELAAGNGYDVVVQNGLVSVDTDGRTYIAYFKS
jgi:hypothetical protein